MSNNTDDKNFEIQVLLTDVMLRITSLENVLIEKNIVSKEELLKSLNEVTKQATEKIIESIKK